MSMYSLVFGKSEWPTEIMRMFGLTPEMIGRYRDHWIERDPTMENALILAVYTRNGGGNREDYAEQIGQMQALATYVSDEDDTFDSTYATFRFRMSRQAMESWLTDLDHAEIDPSVTVDKVLDQLFKDAEPTPRNMSVVWEAMIATLPGHTST